MVSQFILEEIDFTVYKGPDNPCSFTFIQAITQQTTKDVTHFLATKRNSIERPRTEGLPDPRDQTSEATAQVFQAANDQIDQD